MHSERQPGQPKGTWEVRGRARLEPRTGSPRQRGGARIFKSSPANSSAQPGLRTTVLGTGDPGAHFFMPGSSKILGTVGSLGIPPPRGLWVPFSAQSTHPIAAFAVFRMTVRLVLLAP